VDRQLDLVVIVTSAGASTVAYKCREAGWTVAIVDARPYGGPARCAAAIRRRS
jgi:glutathione reductase (NADPH)